MAINRNQDISSEISLVQQYIFGILTVILPISILPFPWDYSEKGMAITVLFFTLFLLGLEIFKVVWTGKFSTLRKDIDFIIFSLLIALSLSTIFAGDVNLSLYGYNYRLGPGLLCVTSIIIVTFLVRSFINDSKAFLRFINIFLIGSILTSIISIITLFGGNFFELIPKISNLGSTGLPIMGSFVVMVIYNIFSIFLAYISLYIYEGKQEQDLSWFAIVTILVNLVSLVLFSTNITAFYLVLLLFAVWFISLMAIFLKDKKMKIKDKVSSLVLPFIILLLSLLMRIDTIRNFIFSSTQITSPLRLSIDFSWQIASQTLTETLKNGIFGLGLDSFGVAFTRFKPIDLMNVNLLNGTNEVFTFLSNAGFLWFMVWLVLGWYVFKDLVRDIKEYTSDRNILVLLDILQVFLYLASFLTTYSVLLRFLFFLSISLLIVARNIIDRESVNNLLLKIWSVDAGPGKKDQNSLTPVLLTILVVICVALGSLKIGSTLVSSLYLLRAESYILNKTEDLDSNELNLQQKEEIVNNLDRWYGKALKYDRRNPLTNRKFSNISVDKLSVLVDKYEDMEDEEILNDVVSIRNQAFEYSREAINLSPSIYANYNNRVDVYLAIINLGYTEYIRDAISVINEAINKNPYDYENYYNKGQLYYILQNYDLALESSTQALSIKGDYVPALILSASINGRQNKTQVQLSYLQAAKTILEENDYQDTQLYKSLTQQMESIEAESTDDNEDVPETEQ
jgi:tetratricopeptide (TPR) repeat protein